MFKCNSTRWPPFAEEQDRMRRNFQPRIFYNKALVMCIAGLLLPVAPTVQAEPGKIPPHDAFNGRFRATRAGTVVDETRQLIWRRCSHGQHDTGLTCAGRPQVLTFERARKYCASLQSAPGVVWRLPNLSELASLADPGRVRGAKIDPRWFPATDPYGYWTRSHDSGPDGVLWSIFDFGDARDFGVRGGRYHVRCVAEWFGSAKIR